MYLRENIAKMPCIFLWDDQVPKSIFDIPFGKYNWSMTIFCPCNHCNQLSKDIFPFVPWPYGGSKVGVWLHWHLGDRFHVGAGNRRRGPRWLKIVGSCAVLPLVVRFLDLCVGGIFYLVPIIYFGKTLVHFSMASSCWRAAAASSVVAETCGHCHLQVFPCPQISAINWAPFHCIF